MTARVDVFADLSTSGLNAADVENLLSQWASRDSLGFIARHLAAVVPAVCEPANVVGLPSDWLRTTATPVNMCAHAFERAAVDQVPLLVLLCAALPGRDAVGELLAALELDQAMI